MQGEAAAYGEKKSGSKSRTFITAGEQSVTCGKKKRKSSRLKAFYNPAQWQRLVK
jgi:hypothetical protein